MKNLVIGASSYVWSSIYDKLKNKHDTIGTYNSNKLFEELVQLDITKSDAVAEIMKTINPDLVILVSGISGVSNCNKDPSNTERVNIYWVKNVLNSLPGGTKIIYISAFGAVNQSEYLYWNTKKEADKLVGDYWNFVIIRPSLVLWKSPNEENDRPFNRIVKNIKDWTKAAYEDWWSFQPTYLQHINETIEVILRKNISNKIIPVITPEQTTRYKVAKDILQHFDIPVFKEENNEISSDVIEDLSILSELGIPTYSYEDIITRIVWELQDVKKK